MIKFRVPDNFVIIKKESKGVEYYMMNKDDLPKKDKKVDKKKEVTDKKGDDKYGYKEEKVKAQFREISWKCAY